jgi:hypothetical protein
MSLGHFICKPHSNLVQSWVSSKSTLLDIVPLYIFGD